MKNESRNAPSSESDDALELDFDALSELAARDPAAFERRRRELVDAFIAATPSKDHRRLRAMQWRIDKIRGERPPLGACVSLYRMMWERLSGDHGLMDFFARGSQLVFSEERGQRVSKLFTRAQR